MFMARNSNFYLMTIYTDQDEVATGIPVLKVAYEYFQNKTPNEDDIIFLCVLSPKAPGVIVGSYITMDSIANIPNIVFTIRETNTKGEKAYDNIIFQSNFTCEYSDSSDVHAFLDKLLFV